MCCTLVHSRVIEKLISDWDIKCTCTVYVHLYHFSCKDFHMWDYTALLFFSIYMRMYLHVY